MSYLGSLRPISTTSFVTASQGAPDITCGKKLNDFESVGYTRIPMSVN